MLGRPDGTSPSIDRTAGSRRHPRRAADDGDGDAAHERERAFRRSVGPMAWAVLADLCQDARPDNHGVVVVAASARQLAANVGIGKDTAARALRRLAAAGVLRRRPQATDDAGRFGCCTYELHLEFRLEPPRPPDPDTETYPCPVHEDTDDRRDVVTTGSENVRAVVSASGSRRSSSRRDTRRRRATDDQLSLLDASGDARHGVPP